MTGYNDEYIFLPINALERNINMESETIDTLAVYQRLKNASLQDEAAREIAELLKDVVEKKIVKRGDLEEVKSALTLEIENSDRR